MTGPSLTSPGMTHRLFVGACCLALLATQHPQAWAAAPSQTPLISNPANSPKPNVVLTLDDSGSMAFQYIPERRAVATVRDSLGNLTSATVPMPSDARIYLDPRDLAKNTWDSGNALFVTADPNITGGALLLQQHMRSPHVNSIYYNPATVYRPWKDASGRDFTNATFNSAFLDPMRGSPNATEAASASNLRVALNSTVDLSAKWYCSVQDWQRQCVNRQASTRRFNPALVYLLANQTDPNVSTNFTRFDLNAAVQDFVYPAIYQERIDAGQCRRSGNNTLCPANIERQNFANWFSYYRSRLMVAQATIPEVFSQANPELRVGWGTIHARMDSNNNFLTTPIDGQNSYVMRQGVRPLDGVHLQSMTRWMRNDITLTFGTPLKQALQDVANYYRRTDSSGNPWRDDLTRSQSVRDALACRRAINIMVTDGYYNTTYAPPVTLDIVGNQDQTAMESARFPGPKNAQGQSVLTGAFADAHSDSLADLAMQFWLSDLQTDMADRVPRTGFTPSTTQTLNASERLAAVKGNPANWQHLTLFTVGFGVTGTMPATDATLSQLLNCGQSGGRCWPSDSLDQIDDLWHAALNSRGQYFSAKNPTELKNALAGALRGADPAPQAEAGVTTASFSLITNNAKYVPEYKAVSWTGDLVAYSVNSAGATGGVVWRASEQMPAYGSRNVFIRDGDRAIRLTPTPSTDESSSLQSALTNELRRFLLGELNVPGLRSRESALGDIINSAPLFVRQGADQGYASADSSFSGATSYQTYLSQKQQRSAGLIFVGSNGGMLHAFNSNNGQEVFAYVPEAALPKIPLIARPDYGSSSNYHQYVVDGQLVEADVYLTDGGDGSWQNVVVGTLGAGGRGLFALNVPLEAPTTISGTNLMWEVSSDDVGHITSTPQVGRLPDGRWVAFAGNGVGSPSSRAALLMVDIASGTLTSIRVPSGSSSKPEGMGGVALVIDPVTRVVRNVYAGDTHGQLWRFDVLASTDGSEVVVGYGSTPLFTATDRDEAGAPQSITAAPIVARHPDEGQVVVFNTGQLLYDTDKTSTQVQTVYGIRDRQRMGLDTRELTAPSITRQQLAKQTILQRVNVTQNNGEAKTFFDLSAEPIDWSQQQGWRLDLIVPGASGVSSFSPQAIYDPVPFGRSVLISAIQPPRNEISCDSAQGVGYAFFIKALTGARSTIPSVDTNGDGLVNDSDRPAAGGFLSGPGEKVILGDPATGAGITPPNPCLRGVVQSVDRDGQTIKDCSGRRIQDRVWRQLLNPPTP